ncbi:MAG TPA: hypothetical protein VFE51_25020 [Verrucomicrobiae bacterium]|nr:hypothetical protein [Verrucomicrobiae bacterium]
MTALSFVALFSVLQNIDNLVLAGAYRWQSVEITKHSNLFIAFLSALFTELAIVGANWTKTGASLAGWDHYTEAVGRGILVMIGVWTLITHFSRSLFPHLHTPSVERKVHGGLFSMAKMSFREAAVVGTALAVDNLGPSFAFGLVNPTGPTLALTLSALTGLGSVLAVWAGQTLGAKGPRQLQKFPPKLVAGCLILGIAFCDPGDIARDHFRLLAK